MKTLLKVIYGAAIALIIQTHFVSCLKDVKTDIKNLKPLPVINAAFTQDSIWKVNVTLSTTPGGVPPTIVNNAIVKIFAGNQLIEQLVYRDNGDYVSPSFKKPLTGIRYSVEVSVPGFETVQANDSIPAALQTVSIFYDTIKLLYSSAPGADPVEVNTVIATLTDLATEKSTICYNLYIMNWTNYIFIW